MIYLMNFRQKSASQSKSDLCSILNPERSSYNDYTVTRFEKDLEFPIGHHDFFVWLKMHYSDIFAPLVPF